MMRQEDGQHAERLEAVLRRLDLIRAQDHQPPRVGGQRARDAEAVGDALHLGPQVEHHRPRLARDAPDALAVEDVDQVPHRPAVGLLPEGLHPRALEQRVGHPHRGLLQAGGERRGQGLGPRGQPLLQPPGHVHVGVELVRPGTGRAARGSRRSRAAARSCPPSCSGSSTSRLAQMVRAEASSRTLARIDQHPHGDLPAPRERLGRRPGVAARAAQPGLEPVEPALAGRGRDRRPSVAP